MDKAKGMEHLEGAGSKPNLVALSAKHIEGGLRKAGAQALSARKHGITHGLVQAARTVAYRG